MAGMIEDLKTNVPMEVRPNSEGDEYLEAVVLKKDMKTLDSVLVKYLGQPAKAVGVNAKFSGKIAEIADSLGGLRKEQTFFCRESDGKIFYAALWPWQSDPERTTLKAGHVPAQ